MRAVIANVQTGFEGLRWLRDEAEVEGRFFDYVRHGHLSDAALVAIRGLVQRLPAFDIKNVMPKLLRDDYNYLGMGAEAIVVRDEDEKVVRKYLTGKTQKPDELAERLIGLHETMQPYVGEFLVPTEIEVTRERLFKGLRASDYVRLTQPFVDIEHMDPHLDPQLLEEKPEIAEALGRFTSSLVDLFDSKSLLMDTVNKRNIVWGSYDPEQSVGLHMLDTLPLDYTCKDFIGIHVPFWSPDLNVESLADLVNTFGPDLSEEFAVWPDSFGCDETCDTQDY